MRRRVRMLELGGWVIEWNRGGGKSGAFGCYA